MIPMSITLKNFLSYGGTPQTISFEEYDLICLSGKNGHGKSALLDAMTWALWGAARKTTGTNKPDEGLLRLGSRQMVVLFECISSGKRYRVRREFAKTHGKPYAALDFSLFDKEKKMYRSLTDKTIRRTQAKIEHVIGLDFDTYVNSAFLRQGNANEFSKKSPKDRKQILASILGVNRYDALQKQALERMRAAQQEKKVLMGVQAQDEEFLAQEGVLRRTLKEHKQTLRMLSKQYREARAQRETAQRVFDAYLVRKEEVATRIKELASQEQQLQELKNKWGVDVASWRVEQQHFLQRPSRENIEKQLHEMQKQDERFRVQHTKRMELQEQVYQVQQCLLQREQALEKKAGTLREKLMQREQEATLAEQKAAQHAAQCKEYVQQLEAEMVALKKIDEEVAVECQNLQLQVERASIEKAQFEKRRHFYRVHVQQLKWLHTQQEELRHKEAVVHDRESPTCPLCEQVLTLKRKQFLQQKMIKQKQFVMHRTARLTCILDKLKQVLLRQHEVVQAHEVTVQKNESVHAHLAELARRKKEVAQRLHDAREKEWAAKKEEQKAHEHMQCIGVEKAEIEQEIKRVRECDEERQNHMSRYKALSAERDALVYDAAAHALIQKKLQEAQRQLSGYIQLQEKIVTHRQQRLALTAQRIELKAEEKKIGQQRQELAQAGIDQAREKMLHANVATTADAEKNLEQNRERVLTEIGRVENSQTHLKERKKQHRQRAEHIVRLTEDIDDYQFLSTLWGKNGIQALLIEEAIPEIEAEANRLLARLTQNQAQIFIESLRDLKRGGVKETLDIKIADTMGVRPYEMFSGGETFRIDFALRIAISKLLARRAGAALQVLIIDEGFGSQDEEGLAKLMSVLYAIRSDFEKIIIVSHLSAFKDNFPVHFVVEKQATGSVVSIEERG